MMHKFWQRKQWGYRQAFDNEAGKIVLADLRIYCHATKTAFSSDPLEMARIEGRREVFMRVMDFLKVDYDTIYNQIEEIPNE